MATSKPVTSVSSREFNQDTGRAIGLLQLAWSLHPRLVPLWLALLEIYWLEGMRDDYVDLALRFRSTFPTHPQWPLVVKLGRELDPAVEAVVGFTRYAIEGDPARDATISIVDRGGLSRDVPSRVERTPQLMGTKRRVASEKEVLVARGRRDGRTVLMVPEVKGGECTGITLLHVRFHDRLPAEVVRGVLQAYDRRYDRLVDWVSETEGDFRDDLLADLPVADLLIEPISDMADHWRRS